MLDDYKYKRVLLKISGEALAGNQGYGIDPRVVDDLAEEILPIVKDARHKLNPLETLFNP